MVITMFGEWKLNQSVKLSISFHQPCLAGSSLFNKFITTIRLVLISLSQQIIGLEPGMGSQLREPEAALFNTEAYPRIWKHWVT